MISIISPIFNEEENIEELVRQVTEAVESTGESFEFLLVENGSSDRSIDIIRKLNERDPRIKYVRLSRNFGHQGGIWAGLNYAKGSAVISMDGDLQHPPELLPRMVELWKQGNDVVFTVKIEKNTQGDWRFYPTRLFYWLLNKISEVRLSYGQSDFRLLDRKVVDVLINIPEKDKFLRGMVEWVGFKQASIGYEVSPRIRGKSKFHLLHYLEFALDGIFSFSILPLRLFLWFGFSISIISFLYGLYEALLGVLYLYFPGKFEQPSGYATLVVAISFLGSIQLLSMGILGEYIGRVYRQTKGRPDFIINETKL
jgi:polyisoprenyl-phosphate glycosyltransferase